MARDILPVEREARADETALASVDLVLGMIEFLCEASDPMPLTAIARGLGISKPRAHRHLRSLIRHGYVVQEAATERYAIGVKLLALGESVRDRFDVLGATRPTMGTLRDATGQTVTVSSLVDGAVVVLELLQGKTLIEFGVRAGASLDLHASAHGLIALAYGPPHLRRHIAATRLHAWTASTPIELAALDGLIERTRARGWATAPDWLMVGVNALAAPIVDFRGAWRGTIAIVGSSQFIAPDPAAEQVRAVLDAAAQASRNLGHAGAAS